ncbi:MAG: LacI family DNA-binding transcriptional regulator [Catenulisporales bacterium]|nr:LacI family DNA-binding transcriptional regulator [Catenulisporales bacterium]
MAGRPTMKDVARTAGVSLMTVSRVVAGESGVAPRTAARVEEAIKTLGYQRNDIARNLRRKAQDSRTIGLVVDDLANPFFSALARSVEDEAYRRGFLVLVASTNDDAKREREVVSAFCSRQVDGLVLVPTGGNRPFFRAQMARGVKVVCVDRPAAGLDVDCVAVDNRAGAGAAIRHLLEQGHRRIAYLGDRQEIWTQRERFAGYEDALAAAGLRVEPDLVRHGLRGHRAAASAISGLMTAAAPPTALFSGNDLVTLGAVEAGATHRFALVGFDDFLLADKLNPPVSVVSQDPGALGRTAAQLLFGRIEGDAAAPRSVVLATRFIDRGSGAMPEAPGIASK